MKTKLTDSEPAPGLSTQESLGRVMDAVHESVPAIMWSGYDAVICVLNKEGGVIFGPENIGARIPNDVEAVNDCAHNAERVLSGHRPKLGVAVTEERIYSCYGFGPAQLNQAIAEAVALLDGQIILNKAETSYSFQLIWESIDQT